MKITSNLKFNTKLIAAHKVVAKDAKSNAALLVGSSLPNILRIIAGSTIELPDNEWVQFEKAAAVHLKNGSLTLTESPKLSADDQAKADKELEADLRAQMAALKSRQDSAATESVEAD